MKDRTIAYINTFVTKDLDAVAAFFADDMRFWDPNLGSRAGAEAVKEAYREIFEATGDLSCEVIQVLADGDWTVLEFRLQLGDDAVVGTDVIHWNAEGQIQDLRAYVNPPKA